MWSIPLLKSTIVKKNLTALVDWFFQLFQAVILSLPLQNKLCFSLSVASWQRVPGHKAKKELEAGADKLLDKFVGLGLLLL